MIGLLLAAFILFMASSPLDYLALIILDLYRNIFTSVCQEFCPQGGVCLPQCMLGYTPPRADPPWSDPPPQQTATAADGTHPTGMHSCINLVLQQQKLSLQMAFSSTFPQMIVCSTILGISMGIVS